MQDQRLYTSRCQAFCKVCTKCVVAIDSKEQLIAAVQKGQCVSFAYQYNDNRKNKDDLFVIKKRPTGSKRVQHEVRSGGKFLGRGIYIRPPELMFENYTSDCSEY